MAKEKIILIGGGGHCKVVIDAIYQAGNLHIEGIIDRKLNIGDKVFGIPVIGDDNKLPDLYRKRLKNAFISIGSVGDCSVRKRIYQMLKQIGFSLVTVIHPSAVIGYDCDMEEGVFIAAGVVINPCVKIGRNAIINTSASIDHDCEIGSFVHITPGVTLSGGVKIGEGTHIGTGANVIQNINIGKNCLIKAGELVRNDFPGDGSVYDKI